MKNNFDSQDNNSLPLMNMHDMGKLDQYGVFVKKKQDIKKLPDDDRLSHLRADFTQSGKIPSFEDAAMSKKDDDSFDFAVNSKDDFQQESVIPPFSADSEQFDFGDDDFTFDDPLENKDSLAFLESEDDTADDSFLLHDDKYHDPDDYLADAFEDIALKDFDDLKTDELPDTKLFTVPELMPSEDTDHDEVFFNDLEAVKTDLLAEPNNAGSANEQPERKDALAADAIQPQGQDKSTELLLKIAQEIDNLKAELTSIKAELAAHALRLLPEAHSIQGQPDSKAATNVPRAQPTPASGSGFFSDDDSDNTIALTGDELNNLVVASVQAESADPDHIEALDNSSFNLDAKYVNPAPENLDLVDEDLDEDNALPDLTAHWTSTPLKEDTSAQTAIDTEGKLLDDIPTEQEITVPSFKDSLSPAETFKDEPAAISSFAEELLAEPEEIPAAKESLATFDEPISDAEVDIPVLQVQDIQDYADLPKEDAGLLGDPISDAEADIPVFQTEDVQDGEILLYEEDKRLLEQSVSDAETDIPVLQIEDVQSDADLPEEETKRLDEPVSDAEADIPVLQTEEVQDDEVPLYEEDKRLLEQSISSSNKGAPLLEAEESHRESGSVPPLSEEKADGTVSMPVELKNEIKSVLAYMDRLLEALPESKIEEFAKSEYFEVYKHLFDELGISK